MENKEKAIRLAMKHFGKDMEIEGYVGIDRMAFMNVSRKAIEEYQRLEQIKEKGITLNREVREKLASPTAEEIVNQIKKENN